MSPPKLNDPTIPISSFFVLKPNPEAEPMNFAQKVGENKNKTTIEEENPR